MRAGRHSGFVRKSVRKAFVASAMACVSAGEVLSVTW